MADHNSENSELRDAHETVDHAGPRGASQQAVAAGHETGDVNARGLMYLGLVLMGTNAFIALCMWGLYTYFRSTPLPPQGPTPDVFAEKRDKEVMDRRVEQVPGPRLEGLKAMENPNAVYGTSTPIPDPKANTVTGPFAKDNVNPPQFHADDLWPSRVPGLTEYKWIDPNKKEAVIPIDQAMKAALKMNRFPVQQAKAALPPALGDAAIPKPSNSGRGLAEGGK
jgi:hypothetical protein